MRWLRYEKQYKLPDPNPICQLYKNYRRYVYSYFNFEKNWQYIILLKELYDKFAQSKTISSKINFSTACSCCKRKKVIKLFEELGFKVIRYEKLYGKIKVTIIPL